MNSISSTSGNLETMNKQISKEEFTLKEFFANIRKISGYLLSKSKIIALVVLLGILLGFAYSYFKKPIYTATLSFALEDESGGGGGLGGALGLASQFGLDIGGSGGGMFSGSNLTELFRSRSMVEQTLLNPAPSADGTVISLAEMFIQNEGWREKWQSNAKFKDVTFPPNATRNTFTRAQDSILGVMYENLSKSGLSVAQKDKKISIITIDVFSTSELFAKSFTEALAKEVSDFYINTKSKKARINMAILERQTDSIRRELNGAITGVAIANDNTFNLNPALNVRRAPSARRQVDVQANTAILTELVKQGELAKVTLRKDTPLIQIIDTPILPLHKEKFGLLKGMVLGGFLSGFLIVLILLVNYFIKKSLA